MRPTLEISESIEPVTRQEVLDGVVEHFLVKKRRPSYEVDCSREEGIRCVYRKRSGVCCAIGLFLDQHIPKLTVAELDKIGGVDDLFQQCPTLIERFDYDDLVFLEAIQDAHDTAAAVHHAASSERLKAFRAHLTKRLKYIAEDYNLEFNYPTGVWSK